MKTSSSTPEFHFASPKKMGRAFVRSEKWIPLPSCQRALLSPTGRGMGDRSRGSLYLLNQVIPIGVKIEKWIVKVFLEDTIRAIHRAIGDGVDHIVTAADMVGSSGTGFQTPPIKMGNEKIFFPAADGIGHRRKLFDESSLVLNCFYRNIGQTFKNGLRDRILFSLFIEINFFDLEGQHTSTQISNVKAGTK